MRHVLVPLLLLAAACGDDRDQDGFGADVDCDDGDPTVFPDAPEICNDIDDDCDGLVDPPGSEGTHAVYPDKDGDGLGDLQGVRKTCDVPLGWTDVPGDCDDDDENVGACE